MKNILSLQVEMKKFLTYIVAAVMMVWYSLSIIGFDVHTCNQSGEVYVTTAANGMVCEVNHHGHKELQHDHVDPHHVHSESCCHSHGAQQPTDGVRIERKECCSDDYHVICLTGVRTDDKSSVSSVKVSGTGAHPVLISLTEINQCLLSYSGNRVYKMPDQGTGVSHNLQAVYNVWRI